MKCITEVGQNQHPAELEVFAGLLAGEQVKSYLEIGSKFGCSLWKVANALPVGSRVVSIDLPNGGPHDTRPHLQECIGELKLRGYDAWLIIGNSLEETTRKAADNLGPYDAIFIDANHTLPYVTKDWQNYGAMGRLIAFHDIGFNPKEMPPHKKPIEVQILWNQIKPSYRHTEIRLCDDANGIGVLWRT